jgi:NAD(P)-dependent dehydrogenase (short-subunit alcohol dehydrogenase family)
VNAVAPGPVATELFLGDKTEEQIAHLSNLAPLERLGKPSDIASVVSFLAGRTEVGSTPRSCAQTVASPNSQSALWTPFPPNRNQRELS